MIDTEALRKKVIDLAIQGKLTEQFPSDGDAESLYAKIQEEKAKLIKEGKTKKENTLSSISDDEIPFEIPNNWKWVRLGDVSILDGTGIIRSGSEQFENGDYYYLKMNNIGNFTGKCDYSNMVMVNATKNEFDRYVLKEGDFLFNTRNSVELVGKCAVVRAIPYDNILFNNNILRMRFCCGMLPDFIKYFFISNTGLTALRRFVSSTTNVAAIYQRQIVTMIVPIPPVLEQKRIVEKLDTVLAQIDIIDTLQQQYASDLSVLKAKIIDAGIRGKLTEQLPEDGDAEILYSQIQEVKAKLIKEGKIKKEKPLPEINADEIPFEIPKNWKWVRLSDISDTNIGLTYHPENVVEHGTVVLRSNNIRNGKFDYADLIRVNCVIRDNQVLHENDILICSRNGSKNLVGKCAIYEGELGEVSFGAFMAILRTSLYKYVYYYLLTNVFRRYFLNDDTKQINQVTQEILKRAIIPLPPLSEQRRITEKIDELINVMA